MKNKLIAPSLMCVCVCLLGIFAVNRFSKPQIITTNGECLTSVPKDRTAVTVRISVLDKSPAKSMKLASAKAAEINDFLKTLDVKVQTSEFNSYEKTEWNHETQKSEFLGIETNIALDVSADKIETIENVLDKFAGVNDIYITNLRMFTSAEAMKPAMESCLGGAVENAHERATALATGAGKRVGKLLAVSYGQSDSHDVISTANFRVAKAALADTGNYTAGVIAGKDTDISVSVSATFEIK